MLSYIQNNPHETQRLVGVKYEQLEHTSYQKYGIVQGSGSCFFREG